MRRARRRVRRLLPALLVGFLGAVLLAGWLGSQAWQLKNDLQIARDSIASLEQKVRDGDAKGAANLLAKAQDRTGHARQVTSEPVWRFASRLPLIGDNLLLGTGLARSVDQLSQDVLPGTLRAADLLIALRQRRGGAVELAPFGASAAPLRASAHAVVKVQSDLRTLDRLHVVGLLRDAKNQLGSRVDRLTSSLIGASVAAEVIPSLLGERTPQRYFLALQNNAESRGSGGLIAAFGLVTAHNGSLTLERTGVNDELVNPPSAPLTLDRDFRARYGSSESDRVWLNANESPDFPTTGRIVTSLWNATQPQHVSGVVALDPVAIAYVLRATGPLTLEDGTKLSAEKVADFTMRKLYEIYPDDRDTPRRTAFLRQLLRLAFQRLTAETSDPAALAEQLGRAVLEGHLQVYSADATVQAALSTTRIAGALPVNRDNVLGVVTQNLAGGKLDYYLRRKIRYSATRSGNDVDVGDGQGTRPELRGQLSVTLRNTAPSIGLPPYVTKRADRPADARYPVGQNRLWVSVYLGRGAQLASATVDGRRIGMTSEREKGLTVLSTQLNIDPGTSVTLHLTVFQPAAHGNALTYLNQPLAFPDEVHLLTTKE